MGYGASSSSEHLFHWRSGPRDATEGALFAACRALAVHGRDTYKRQRQEGQQQGGEDGGDDDAKAYANRVCQEVAVGAARVAGGGLSALLKTG